MILNLQPSVITTITNKKLIGLSSRFLFFSASDPSAPDVAPHGPCMEFPWPVKDDIRFEESVFREIDAIKLSLLRGTSDILDIDGHLIWIRAKLASIFCIWDKRPKVTMEDWNIAELVVKSSCAVRDAAVEISDEVERALKRKGLQGMSHALQQLSVVKIG